MVSGTKLPYLVLILERHQTLSKFNNKRNMYGVSCGVSPSYASAQPVSCGKRASKHQIDFGRQLALDGAQFENGAGRYRGPLQQGGEVEVQSGGDGPKLTYPSVGRMVVSHARLKNSGGILWLDTARSGGLSQSRLREMTGYPPHLQCRQVSVMLTSNSS